jgi:aminoglycoside 2'-N-acetyltransferase I
MSEILSLEVTSSSELTPDIRFAVHELCNQAYGEDLGMLFAAYAYPTHVLGFFGANLVSHAMWIVRWLQPGESLPLRTAYVEMVATHPRYRGRGLATAVLRRLGASISGFELGALSTGHFAFYARMGWVLWRGPLFIRSSGQMIPTPEERVMILRLPNTPALDLDAPLSAEWRAGELW